MANSFQLKLMTPYRALFAGEVEAVGLPGEMGEFGVLSNHTKFVSTLRPGVVRFVANGQTQRFAVGGGFAETMANGVVVLADSAERPEEINVERSRESERRAKDQLNEVEPTDEKQKTRLEARIARAQNRIKLAQSN